MLHRKLLEVLVRFTPSELKQLRLFLESPYFLASANQALILSLFDLILENDADELSPQLQKESVFKILFPRQQYVEKEKSKLDSISSDLFKLVRHFLYINHLYKEIDSPQSYVPLLQFYRNHGLEERFWQTVSQSNKLQKDSPLRGAEYYLNQFRIEEEVSNFQGIYNTNEGDANLINATLNLQRFSVCKNG